MQRILLIAIFMLPAVSHSNKFIVANNTRLTYDYGSEVKPYIANEVKFTNDINGTVFSANKLRLGFRYKINDNIRFDPHVFMDNKLKDGWAFAFGPALRLDITY
jgi:hypothetical protein